MANLSAKLHLPATILSLLAISISVYGTNITIQNQCSYDVTTCYQAQGANSQINCLQLHPPFSSAPGGSLEIDVGSVWNGTIWGFAYTNASQVIALKPHANLAEFSIGLNGQDYYDVSNVNAYNIALKINVTNASIPGGGMQSGLHCGSPSCTIRDLSTICKASNVFTTYNSISQSCKNTDGAGNVATAGTKVFKAACPSFKSYSQDNKNDVYNCNAGSTYEVLFCPDFF